MANDRKRKKSGFANTKEYPHKRHPANYRKTGKDDIEYITFTHHDIVDINGKKYVTIPLLDNIDKTIQKKNKGKKNKEISYAFPKVYVGKRSSLGKEEKKFEFTKDDYVLISKLFNELPKENVSYSKKTRKK